MDQNEYRTLRLLEEIEKCETKSQRDLSRNLNISLGLVNSFVKRLAQKGYFKITTIPKNRVKYLLTPKGAAEKTRLTYEYIQSSIQFYRNTLHKIKNLIKELQDEGVQTIVFYGVSDLVEISHLLFQESGIELVGIIDDQSQGRVVLNKKILGTDQINKLTFDRIFITDIIDPLEAINNITAKNIEKDKIVLI